MALPHVASLCALSMRLPPPRNKARRRNFHRLVIPAGSLWSRIAAGLADSLIIFAAVSALNERVREQSVSSAYFIFSDSLFIYFFISVCFIVVVPLLPSQYLSPFSIFRI